MKRIIAVLAAGALAVAGTAAAKAQTATLKATLSTPVLMEGKKQSAYLKVAVTGFMPEDLAKRPPVNVGLVIDKSGSMAGAKIEEARRAAVMAVNRLRSDDIVSVVTYDHNVQVLVPAARLTDKEMVISAINSIQSGGNTALFGGVSKGAQEIRKFMDKERVNRIVLLSDGLANVGPSSPAELASLGKSLFKEGVSVSTVGLGTGYNEDLMSQLADKAGGSHYFAERAQELAAVYDREFDRALSVVGQETVAKVTCQPGVRPVRVINRDAEISGQTVTVQLDQLYAGSEKYLVLEVEVPAGEKGVELPVADVEVTYTNMLAGRNDRLEGRAAAKFTSDAAEVDKTTDREAAVSVVEQLATEKSILARSLRNAGKVAEAREVLDSNSAYLAVNADKLDSVKLREQTIYNDGIRDNLDERNWQTFGKVQSEGDVWRVKQ